MPRLDDESDARLVALAVGGDRVAFGVLYERHAPLLRGLCRRALHDEALVSDAMQEAALQALLNLGSLRRPERFGAWLGGIGLNICRAMLRRRGRSDWSWEAMTGGRKYREALNYEPGPAELVAAFELRETVRRAIANLPHGQRAAVLHFYLQGLSYAETAAALAIDVSAVRTRLYKARRSLRAPLQHIGADETMTTSDDARYIPVRVKDVLARPVAPDKPGVHVVVLESLDGTDTVPIWIGPQEGIAIALLLENVQPPRPLTYTFMAAALIAAGAHVREVRITRLAGDTYYASTMIDGPGGIVEVDARPSDALALALCAGASIVVERAILPLAAGMRDRHQREHAAAANHVRNAPAIAADAQKLWSTRSPARADEHTVA